jgi:hypothetical protein
MATDTRRGEPRRELERRLRRLLRRRPPRAPAAGLDAIDEHAFRAIVARRLDDLERDVAEVRARINGLLFVVAGAAATQVILRLLT